MSCRFSRRRLLAAAGSAAAGSVLCPRSLRASVVPAAPVAIAKRVSYGSDLLPTMATMFDRLGGLGTLVRNKTVAIKLNMTGGSYWHLNGEPLELAQWVHPNVVGVLVYLVGRAGANRIRLLECVTDAGGTLESFMASAGWDPNTLRSAAARVEFENTNFSGGKPYSRLVVPYGGLLFPGYDLNHSYTECDVFVSLAKLKQHFLAGITLSMKNVFGSLPLTIYGTSAGWDEPGLDVTGFRGEVMHDGSRPPSLSAPQEVDPDSPRIPGYRLPRVITDLAAARPIHLAVIDGIETMAGGEGPWISGTRRVSPRVLIAGTNPVCTDSVGIAVMGFDPMAKAGQAPFAGCDSMFELAETVGIGTRDLSRIEVRGASIDAARFPFAVQGDVGGSCGRGCGGVGVDR